MSFTHKFTQSYNTAAGSLAKEISATDDGQDERDIAVAAETTVTVDIDLVVANLKGVYIEADQNLTVLLKAAAATVQTINLVANVPVAWITGSAAACPLTANCDSLTAQNETATATTLRIRTLRHTAS